MSKEKILHYVATAFEITKMVAVISAKTAVKLFYEGKQEIFKQYAEYHQRNQFKQQETFEKLKSLTNRASTIKPQDIKKEIEEKAHTLKEKAKDLPQEVKKLSDEAKKISKEELKKLSNDKKK